ncbi:hypothetical protein BDL97_05G134100 [Sphagnum fallax]|nr:hypothetical protein BDL97_05G134100 [Sphagnum fallax]KAH8963083.1 hypothetical protein BDL97_05G134100 [Sphagnum fallax]KAH8963084.1 hypothetical protein BDL97_05G134100 [Sphagnum fallax]KAH8963095.1 hypothetical protein BDL97_05G134100 [Sphagnum fallax]
MLEYTEEDKSDEGPPSSSVVERSPAANKTGTADRLVYKLVKVGDDGSVLPATEDEVFQSLVEGRSAELAPSFTGGSDSNEDYEDEEGSGGSLDSDDDDLDAKEDPSFSSELKNLVAERKKLLARFEVVDTMLSRVDAEQQNRVSLEDQAGSVLGHKSNLSVYMSTGDAIGDYKRQRRPNPRYFDFDAKGTHRARAVVNQKPSTWTSTKVQAPKSVGVPVVNSMPNPTSLENLSIRELHEAFRSTYGRDTSVKDKHWLKRQISTGWSKQRDAALSIGSHSQLPSQTDPKVRPEQRLSAEQPLPSSTAVTELVTERDMVNGGQELGTNGVDLTEQLCTNEVDSKQSLCRVLPLAVISPEEGFDASAPGSLNELGAGGAQIAVFGEVVNTGKQVGGKRQRKPNRRYIEDEGEVGPGTVIANCSRPGPAGSDSGGHGSGMSSRLSWRTVITDAGPADLVGQSGTLQVSTLQNSSRANILQGQCTNSGNSSLKHKAEGRATKLVKTTHSAAPASQHDNEGTVLKVKFRLPAAPGRDKDGLYELNEEARDQGSCLLPVPSRDSADLLQPLASDIGGAGPAGEQLVAAPVPTANGGTRRKHHHPWTLHEVMTLVEGVAHCGGGKWADIKKLAFSSIGYRTAVDLKDKWRNLLRASRAQLYPPKQGERKKQFTAAIPDTLLAQVRELAAIQCQEAPGRGAAGMTSRSGRSVHRK